MRLRHKYCNQLQRSIGTCNTASAIVGNRYNIRIKINFDFLILLILYIEHIGIAIYSLLACITINLYCFPTICLLCT